MRPSSCRIPAVVTLGLVPILFGCETSGLQGAKAEVKETTIKLDLPPVPEFSMPSPHPDGTHSVREMRLKGRKLFGTEQKVRGFITWKYDCEASLQTPEFTKKQVQALIAKDPSRCVRPHFYVGDSPGTAPEKSLWVVEVPRKLRKDEVRKLNRAERRRLPRVPRVRLGDEVSVTGTWERTSPAGFANSDGLLVYQSMKTITRAGSADPAPN